MTTSTTTTSITIITSPNMKSNRSSSSSNTLLSRRYKRSPMLLILLLTCCFLLPKSTLFVAADATVACGNGEKGNGICEDPTLCCSSHGFCGNTAEYCSYEETSPVSSPSPVSYSDGNKPTMYPTYSYASECPGITNVMTVNLAYYQSVAATRPENCHRVLPQDIDVAGGGYTHLAYAFAGIDAYDHLIPWDNKPAIEVPLYQQFNALKGRYPYLKTLITIGGWTFNSNRHTWRYFSGIVADANRTATFATSVVDFLQKYNFDGIDIDWEFPGLSIRGGNENDKAGIPLLLQAIRKAYATANRTDYIIAMATPPNIQYIEAGYDLPQMAKYLDFFTILAYAINGFWNNPKRVYSNTDFVYVQNAIDYIINNQSVPSNQLVLGFAAFGVSYTLANASCDISGCPFTGAGPSGCGGNYGNIPRFNIDEYIAASSSDRNVTTRFDSVSSTMELVVDGTNWITYDNEQTWNIRTEYAVKTCLRGYFWWAVDMLTEPVALFPRAGPKPIPPTLSPTVYSTALSETTSHAAANGPFEYGGIFGKGLLLSVSLLLFGVSELLFF